jgi:hypothetical protein
LNQVLEDIRTEERVDNKSKKKKSWKEEDNGDSVSSSHIEYKW